MIVALCDGESRGLVKTQYLICFLMFDSGGRTDFRQPSEPTSAPLQQEWSQIESEASG